MNGLERFEGIQRDVESLERFNLIFVPKDEPEKASEINYLRRIVEK